MDPVTHGLIGATAAQSFADKERLCPAAFTGFAAAMIALDIFIHSANDPLLNIEVHRQFTHSFIFIPVGALIAAGPFLQAAENSPSSWIFLLHLKAGMLIFGVKVRLN